jgi:hypothetical protein
MRSAIGILFDKKESAQNFVFPKAEALDMPIEY